MLSETFNIVEYFFRAKTDYPVGFHRGNGPYRYPQLIAFPDLDGGTQGGVREIGDHQIAFRDLLDSGEKGGFALVVIIFDRFLVTLEWIIDDGIGKRRFDSSDNPLPVILGVPWIIPAKNTLFITARTPLKRRLFQNRLLL
jgi:hypothetical protein